MRMEKFFKFLRGLVATVFGAYAGLTSGVGALTYLNEKYGIVEPSSAVLFGVFVLSFFVFAFSGAGAQKMLENMNSKK